MNKNVIIRQIQVKDVMTKSNAPIGGYCVNPYIGMHPWLQILLCLIHEKIHRPHGRMGNVFGCQELAADQESG